MAVQFSGPFKPQAWRDAIWAITSVFESGTPAGDPAAFQTADEGVISFGRHQATLASGVLARVLDAFFRRSDGDTSRALEQEFAQRMRDRDRSLRHNARLKELLLRAAQEAAMRAAQDEVFAQDFYRPVVAVAERIGVRTPLGLAVLYDTHVQGGLEILVNATNSRLGGGGVGRVGTRGFIDEEKWVRTFLDEREARLHRLADKAASEGKVVQARALRISTFRVRELRQLVDAGNWGLSGTFTVRGQQIDGLEHPAEAEPARPGASFVAFHTAADLGAVPEGSAFTATWRLRNSGNTTWDDDYRVTHVHEDTGSRLMAAADSFPLAAVADRPTVAPGEEVAITLEMTAPGERDRFYFTDWQVADGQGNTFGDVMWLRVVVVAAPDDGDGLLTSDSLFVDDLTIPDGTVIPAGTTFTKQWLVRNTGQRVWGDGYRLVYVGGDAPMTGTFSHLVPKARPGEEVVLSVPMVAPTTPGTVVGTWRLRDDRNVPFGNRFWTKVVVTAANLPTTPLSQNDPRWKERILGEGPRTFGEFGCLVTCYAMMLNAYGEDFTPLELNNRFLQLPAGQGFQGSVILFVAPEKAFAHVTFDGNFKPRPETGASFATFDPNLITRLDQHLAAGQMALAQVDRGPATAYNPDVEQHWVLVVARNGDDYLVLDPLDGQATSLLDKYGQQEHAGSATEALKDAIKSVLFYRSGRVGEPAPVAARVTAGMNLNPDAAHSNPVNSDVLEGIGWVRFPFKAADKQRTVAQSFAEYDPIVQGYAQKGIRSLIVLNQQTVAGGDAPWAGGGDWAGYSTRFAQAVGEIAAHYAHLGDKVAYEIWNEGDNPATPWVSVFVPPRHFAPVLQQAAAAIRTAAPQANIVFGGLSTGPVQATTYVKQVRAALGGRLPVDAIGLHPYGRWPVVRPFPSWGFGTLTEAFQVFKTDFPNTPLWLTEIGISGGANPLGAEHYPAIARYLRDTFVHVAEEHAQQVPVIVWFAWSDNMQNAGIVKADGGHKAHIFDTFAAVRDRTLQGLDD